MNLLKSDPSSELHKVFYRLKRVLWQTRIFWRPQAEPHEMSAAGDWVPPVYISETNAAYLIQVEIPEVRKEDVRVTILNGTLTIAGERERNGTGKKLRLARSCENFAQRFKLPDDTDEDTVVSEYRDGMMNVTLPKSDKAGFREAHIAVS